MKFICAKNALDQAITTAERFTGKNPTLPIIGNILLEAQEGYLRITATNLEYAIQIRVSGEGRSDGKVSVPAKILTAVIQSIEDENITIEEKKGNLSIKTPSRDVLLNGMPVDDFPLLPRIKKTNTFSVPIEEFQYALERVVPSVSTSEFKPELSGVFCKVVHEKFFCAGTDTFRLSEATIKMTKNTEGGGVSFILPHRVSQELSRLSYRNGTVTVSLGDNQIVFETGSVAIISRLIDGTFPEYTAIIPKKFETTGFVRREEFVRAVRASSAFASRLQDVSLTFSKNKIIIHSANQDIGEYTDTIPAALSGKDASVHFNYRYLLDGLSALDEEEVFFGCTNESNPCLLRNKSSESFLYVLMPIRLS